jgi:hypothetical protein
MLVMVTGGECCRSYLSEQRAVRREEEAAVAANDDVPAGARIGTRVRTSIDRRSIS